MNINTDLNIHSFNDELRIFLYNLVRLRNNASITQQEMASQISTSHRNYQRLEKGEAEFSFTQILKISKILKCEVGDLYYFKKGEILKFSELDEGQVANEFGLMDFVCFNERFFYEYEKRGSGEKIHDFALKKPFFINSSIPITIKDSDLEVFNNSCDNLVSREDLLIKKKIGTSFKDRMCMVNLYNKIFRIEKSRFYCQFETQLVVNGIERSCEKVFYVIRGSQNQLFVSGTVK